MKTAVLLSCLGLAAASPLASRRSVPSMSSSKGFRLVLNVTDPSHDFHPSVQHSFVNSIHTGAGLALVGVTEGTGPVFYQNGTEHEHQTSKATTITDSGTPLTPAGISLTKDKGSETVSTANLNFGLGTPGVQLTTAAQGYVHLLPETYLACNESLAYYQGAYFIIIKQAESTVCEETGKKEVHVPKHCAEVQLLPQCAVLEKLPKGSYASHEYALESPCYDHVAAIDWSKY